MISSHFDISTFIIGDIHGCYFTMIDLIEKLPKNSKLIFLGDLCDRGLYSSKVINYVIENGYQSIVGNHDKYFIDYYFKNLKDVTNWTQNPIMGGFETIQSYGGDLELMKNHINWLNNLPNFILIDKYFLTHSFGLPYYQRRELESSKMALLHNRINNKIQWKHDWEKNYKNYDIINIFGHDNFPEVKKGKNFFGIDTGCVYGGKLTAFELKTHKIIQVDVNKKDLKPI